MRATSTGSVGASDKLSVDTRGLQSMLNCGRCTAVEIGTRAGARFKVGKRVLWNVAKVKAYLDILASESD